MDHRVPSRFCSSQARITLVNKIQMAAAAAAGRQREWRQQQQQQLMLRVTHLQRLLLAYVGHHPVYFATPCKRARLHGVVW
jgi:hypothetical protein